MEIISNPSESDIEAFAQLLAEGARDGHFAKEFENRYAGARYLNEVRLTGKKSNYLYSLASGALYVFKVNAEPIGFAFCVDCQDFFKPYEQEIVLFSVSKRYRRKGYGLQAIKLLLQQGGGRNFLARCMPRSTFMVKALVKAGFSRTEMWESKNIIMGFIAKEAAVTGKKTEVA